MLQYLDEVFELHGHIDDAAHRRLVAARELDQGHQAGLDTKLSLKF